MGRMAMDPTASNIDFDLFQAVIWWISLLDDDRMTVYPLARANAILFFQWVVCTGNGSNVN